MAILIAIALLAPASAWADGRIAGKVSRPDGSPIAGARVFFDTYAPQGWVLSDAQGRYTSPQLDAGSYGVGVSEIEGRYGITYPHVSCSSDLACSQGSPVVVRDGEVTSGIDFVMRIGSSLAGRVLRANGDPADNTPLVTAFDREGNAIGSSEYQSGEAGEFSIGLIPPGRYTLLFSAGGFYRFSRISPDLPCTEAEATCVSAGRSSSRRARAGLGSTSSSPNRVRPNEPAEFSIELDRAPRVKGRVLQPDGQPAAGCVVQAFQALDLERQESSGCDEEGDFELFLPPGAYHLLVFGDGSGLPNAGALPGSIPCAYGPYDVRCDLRQAPPVVVGWGAKSR